MGKRSTEFIFSRDCVPNEVGVVEMPRMYPPRMTPHEALTFDWETFRDTLQPLEAVWLTPEVELALVDKTSLWAPSDICGFVGGKDIVTIEDFSPEEGTAFLRFHHELVQGLQRIGNIHQDQYGQMNVAMGFNPEDFNLGAHSIRRLHTHIFTPTHVLTDEGIFDEPLRKTVPWPELSWFNRLKFLEPFSVLFADFLQEWLRENPLSPFLSRNSVESQAGFISLYLHNDPNFPHFFTELQRLYGAMHAEYSRLETIFTDREIDPATQRFLPRAKEQRIQEVAEYCKNTAWLSPRAKELLFSVAEHLQLAEARESPGSIRSASQAWFTKGFAGTMMFSFDRSNEIRFDLFPRVITTSAPEKGVYGLNRPTLISRNERKPTPMETLENEKYLLAVKAVVSGLR